MSHLQESQSILEAAENLPLEEKVRLIQEALQALAYLHRRGVLHRDLKPENVQVVDGSVQVLDFGLAINKNLDQTNSAGTVLYMAPELFDGEAYESTADLYSIGILLYQALTGTHPFEPFDYTFVDRVLDEEPNLEQIDRRLQPLLGSLLAKKPCQRPESANEVLVLIANALGQPVAVETSAILSLIHI